MIVRLLIVININNSIYKHIIITNSKINIIQLKLNKEFKFK